MPIVVVTTGASASPTSTASHASKRSLQEIHCPTSSPEYVIERVAHSERSSASRSSRPRQPHLPVPPLTELARASGRCSHSAHRTLCGPRASPPPPRTTVSYSSTQFNFVVSKNCPLPSKPTHCCVSQDPCFIACCERFLLVSVHMRGALAEIALGAPVSKPYESSFSRRGLYLETHNISQTVAAAIDMAVAEQSEAPLARIAEILMQAGDPR